MEHVRGEGEERVEEGGVRRIIHESSLFNRREYQVAESTRRTRFLQIVPDRVRLLRHDTAGALIHSESASHEGVDDTLGTFSTSTR